jgi:hypothetical protein
MPSRRKRKGGHTTSRRVVLSPHFVSPLRFSRRRVIPPCDSQLPPWLVDLALEEMRKETKLQLTWDQAIVRALATTEARQWLDAEIRKRGEVIPPAKLGGFAHWAEVANEARVCFVGAMNGLAARG